jgi:hypothetical protein
MNRTTKTPNCNPSNAGDAASQPKFARLSHLRRVTREQHHPVARHYYAVPQTSLANAVALDTEKLHYGSADGDGGSQAPDYEVDDGNCMEQQT